jgi:hypothetical protein
MCVCSVRVAVALWVALALLVFPWRYRLPTGCGSGAGFHPARYGPPATLGGRAAGDLADECGEVTGGVQVAIEHVAALIAAECAFGQAQFGFHRVAVRTAVAGDALPTIFKFSPLPRIQAPRPAVSR